MLFADLLSLHLVTFLMFFVSAPECRDIETALYDRTSVRASLAYCVQYFIRHKAVVARAAAKRKQSTQK